MPESFEINASSGPYRVTVGSGLLADALRAQAGAVILIDDRLSAALPLEEKKAIRVTAAEGSKSLEQTAPIVAKLRELGAHRHTHLLAIGGGIIQDIATFVASIYMRGISWSYLPTTLLGMVDSCVGGKSSINVYGYKNLVGNFYPPTEVLIDLNFLRSLNPEQIVGGLCEAAKICYARSAEEFSAYLADAPAINMSPSQAERIVIRSLRAKQWFIEIDEFDQKERLLLNFGHTFGHALEAATEFRISHGVAVGVGMVVAEEYAKQQRLLTPAGEKCVARLTDHVQQLLKELPALVDELQGLDVGRITKKFGDDKKHQADHYRIIVPKGNGILELIAVTRNEQAQTAIHKAYRSAFERLTTISHLIPTS
ncbi:MAG: 3-dehydroquinate synthase [Sulfuricaulis sp.]